LSEHLGLTGRLLVVAEIPSPGLRVRILHPERFCVLDDERRKVMGPSGEMLDW
jgi:hypothetical protein